MLRQIIKLFFNYYMVLKACWAIVLFQVLGFFALVYFDQGQDILRGSSLSGSEVTERHTIAGIMALVFWSWQSWRGSRSLLHLSYFHFWTYRPRYAFRAQVMIPRLLALGPYLIFAWATYKAKDSLSPLVLLSLSLGIWFVIFLYFRKIITIWLRAKRPKLMYWVPDYIPIKNGAYPVNFIWKKHRTWLMIRLIIVIITFALVIFFPLVLSQFLGALFFVLMGFATWLILASAVTFLEMRLRFPIYLTLILSVILFSYSNNNHRVQTLNIDLPERPGLHQAFDEWLEGKDTTEEIPVFLMGAEGGGIRSAYWTASVLGYLEDESPGFSENIFTFSSVSGGSLGVMVHNASLANRDNGILDMNREMLSHDFLAPVSSFLIYPDMLQKFIPVKIPQFDRARILERSWEDAWHQTYTEGYKDQFAEAFLNMQLNGNLPHVMLNGTHVESGFRTVVSDIDLNGTNQLNVHDLMHIMGKDIAVSTAVGLSARFPFLTPPALIYSKNGNEWGSVVDGGYYENLGATTLVEVYQDLREYAKRKGLKVRFHLVFVRNTKRKQDAKPMVGLIEFIGPLRTLANIWGNNGDDVIRSVSDYVTDNKDRIVVIKLTRDDAVNIPLGWYLSSSSIDQIDKLLIQIEPMLKEEILQFTQ